MSEVPAEIRELLAARDAARAAKDYARADELRARIEDRGWQVRDTSEGAVLEAKPLFEAVDPGSIANTLDVPPTLHASVHLLYEGYPADLERFLRGFEAHHDTESIEVVVVDDASADAEQIEMLTRPRPWARTLHLSQAVGWAAARNAGLGSARGALIVLADLSVEPVGDLMAPLQRALSDADVAVAGPYGLRSDDLRSWYESPGPAAHVIEGYLLATRRELVRDAGLLDERFTWYRNADIELSLRLRAHANGVARVVPLPVRRHAHRGWAAVPEDERERRSRRNYRIVLERWGERRDLIGGE